MNLREQKPDFAKLLTDLGFSWQVLGGYLYPNLPPDKAANKLKSKVYGTGAITDEELLQLQRAIEDISNRIRFFLDQEKKARRRKQIINSLLLDDMTDEELESLAAKRKKEDR